jgi:hypothetical protein
MAHAFTVRDLIRSLRSGPYTSIGCYPLFWLTSDGGTLHHACVLENLGTIGRSTRDGAHDGWAVVACDINYEDADMYCDHCGERIESAYAEPEECEPEAEVRS